MYFCLDDISSKATIAYVVMVFHIGFHKYQTFSTWHLNLFMTPMFRIYICASQTQTYRNQDIILLVILTVWEELGLNRMAYIPHAWIADQSLALSDTITCGMPYSFKCQHLCANSLKTNTFSWPNVTNPCLMLFYISYRLELS